MTSDKTEPTPRKEEYMIFFNLVSFDFCQPLNVGTQELCYLYKVDRKLQRSPIHYYGILPTVAEANMICPSDSLVIKVFGARNFAVMVEKELGFSEMIRKHCSEKWPLRIIQLMSKSIYPNIRICTRKTNCLLRMLLRLVQNSPQDSAIFKTRYGNLQGEITSKLTPCGRS